MNLEDREIEALRHFFNEYFLDEASVPIDELEGEAGRDFVRALGKLGVDGIDLDFIEENTCEGEYKK